jgi:hypothetical protein
LDSSTAFQVAQCLYNLSKTDNRTIICTIHQPSDEILSLWDNLAVLSLGRVVYHGSVLSLMDHLRSIQMFPSDPSDKHGIEFLLEMAGKPETASKLHFAWHSLQSEAPHSPDTSCHNHQEEKRELKRQRNSILDEILILSRRHALYSLLSAHGFWSVILRNVVCGVIYGVLYYRNQAILYEHGQMVTLNPAGFDPYAYNLLGLPFSMVNNVIITNAIAVPAFFHLGRYYDVEKVFIPPPNLQLTALVLCSRLNPSCIR